MPVRKRPPRPALQVPLESSRLFPPPERKVSLQHPRHKLGSMTNPAPVIPLPNVDQGQPPIIPPGPAKDAGSQTPVPNHSSNTARTEPPAPAPETQSKPPPPKAQTWKYAEPRPGYAPPTAPPNPPSSPYTAPPEKTDSATNKHKTRPTSSPQEANPPKSNQVQPPSHPQINQTKKARQPKPKGRRLVEAAGVEPASEMARCDMTTCVSDSESRRNANEPARSVPSSLIDLEPRPQTVACALSHKMTLTRQRMGSSPRAAT